MVINTNMSAQSSARLLTESSSLLSKSLARLSSGSRIVSPEDDGAGLAVSMRFDAQINRISAAKNNVGNAISFSQTQDGFLKKVAKALDRMSELAILAQDVTKSGSDQDLYNQEFTTLGNYVKDLAGNSFNGVSLFSNDLLTVTTDSEEGTFVMAGIDLEQGAYTAVLGSDYSSTVLGVSIGQAGDPSAALTAVKAAITQLASDRSSIGANVSRLTYTADQLGVLKDNLTAANSRIKDVDVADESTQFARYNILVQAGTAMLAQANSMPQNVLRLLQ
ncbi:MAG TPA: flagellin [Verrucomicrobiae bacterium]|nr:flagellin [Verrucomicrobiae bacterium]